MSKREDELFKMVRDARIVLAQARLEEEEARMQLAGRKTLRRKADALIEDLLEEIETGKRKDTLTAYIEARGGKREEEGTADEHQRGPTVPAVAASRAAPTALSEWRVHGRSPGGQLLGLLGTVRAGNFAEAEAEARRLFGDNIKLGEQIVGGKPKRRQVHRDESAERPELLVKPAEAGSPWTKVQIDEELERACYPPGGPKPTPWKTFRDLGGITDPQIESVLRQLWGMGSCMFTPAEHESGGPGHTTRGGSRPAFWVGPRRLSNQSDHPPDLTGQALVDRVRKVLDLPRFAVTEEDLDGIEAPAAAQVADRRIRKGKHA